jgi:hypothetical protein
VRNPNFGNVDGYGVTERQTHGVEYVREHPTLDSANSELSAARACLGPKLLDCRRRGAAAKQRHAEQRASPERR